MSEQDAPAGPLSARFEKAVRLFADVGLDPPRTVRQLLSAGFPIALVRARFPAVDERVFVAPPVAHAAQRASGWRARATADDLLCLRGDPHALAGDLLRRQCP